MKIRLSEDLRDSIKAAADKNNRTMNAEIVARLQRTFEALPERPQTPPTDWAERFDLYRIESQMEAIKTQKTLATMQIQMLDNQLDQLAHRHASEEEMLAPKKELQAAKALYETLEERFMEVWTQYRKQKVLADAAGQKEIEWMNEAIDKTLQDELMAVHELEKKVGISDAKRSVVLAPTSSKPKP